MDNFKTPLDVSAIRDDFPILHQEVSPGVPLVYLDNAATYTKFKWDETKNKLTVSGKSSQIAGKSREFKVRYINSKNNESVICVYKNLI